MLFSRSRLSRFGKHQFVSVSSRRLLSYASISVSVFSLLALLLVPELHPSHSFADEPITVNPSIAIGGSGSIALSVNPGQFASSSEDITVTTTNYTGYTMTIAPTSGSNTDLENTSISNVVIPSIQEGLTSQSFSTLSTTAYGLSIDDGASYIPVENGSTINSTSTATNATTGQFSLTLGAKAEPTAPAGTYTKTFTLTALANPASYTMTYDTNAGSDTVTNMPTQNDNTVSGLQVTLSSKVPVRSGYEFVEWNTSADGTGDSYSPSDIFTMSQTEANIVILYATWEKSISYMQDWVGCSTLSANETIILTDNRDGSEYGVVKLPDGNCWMAKNMRLDFATDGDKITAANTNNPTLTFLSNVNNKPTATPSSTALCTDQTSSACVNQVIYDTEYLGDNAIDSNGFTKDDYGVLYNYYTATAGNGNLITSGTIAGDLCPSGWRLPSGGSSSEWYYLNYHVNNGSTSSIANLTASPTNIPLAGYRWSSTKNTDRFMFWANNVYLSNNTAWARYFGFNGSEIKITNGYNRAAALSMRCLTWGNAYLVKFDPNGSSNPVVGEMSSQSIKVGVSTALRANQFTSENYAFAGWNTAPDGSGNNYNNSASVTNLASAGSSITLYAKWSPVVNINYYGNGSTSGATSSQQIASGTSGTLRSNGFVRSGWAFKNWNTAPDGSGTSYNASSSYTASVISEPTTVNLYAQWTPKVTIEYNGNNADSGSVDSQEVVSGETGTIKQNGFIKSSYVFVGWNTQTDGLGTNYNEGASYSPVVSEPTTITLYAQWTPAHVIIYNGNGATSGTMPNEEVLPGQTTNLTANAFEKTGYYFEGWATSSTQGSSVTYRNNASFTAPATVGTTNLYAVWHEIEAGQNWLGCSGLSINDEIVFYDERDNNEYTAVKFSDGNCWMTQNLRLNFSTHGDKITIENTNNPTSGFINESRANPGSSTYYCTSTNGCGAWDQNVLYNASYLSSYPENGTYYSWRTATAGNLNTNGDICPSGWHLPTIDEYSTLNGQINSGSTSSTANLIASPANFVFAGTYSGSSGSVSSRGTLGVYWSSSYANSSSEARTFNIAKTSIVESVEVGRSYSRLMLNSVRCLVGSVWGIRYNPNSQGTMGSMASQSVTVGAAGTIKTNRYIKSGYNFVGWNTQADGNGTMYQPGDSVTDLRQPGESITLYAIWEQGLTVDQAFANAGKTKLNNYYVMQDATMTICESIGINTTGNLIDSRDNTVYSIAKLADGNCWMTKSLRLNLATDGDKITKLNTNNPTSAFVNSANTNPSPNADSWCTGTASSCTDQIVYDNANIGNNTADSTNHTYDDYGVYYNWYTATAGNGTSGMTTGDTIGDICPRGWHLPSTEEFNTLNEAINDGLYSSAAGYLSSPADFVYSGYRKSNTFDSRGTRGYYWSRTASNNGYTNWSVPFSINDATVSMSGSTDYGKADGATLRCVKQRQEYTIVFDKNDNSATGTMPSIKVGVGISETLPDNTFSLANSVCTGWNTAPDGSGTSYAISASISDLAPAGGSITLYAQWVEGHVVEYNGNGADTGIMSSQATTLNTTITLRANSFSKTGYHFVGWATSDAPDAPVVYADKASFTPSAIGTTILYAVWEEGEYMQKFKCSDLANIGDTTTLADKRDGKMYSVAKLADGNCWMTQNLRISGTILAEDSDFTSPSTYNASQYDLTSSDCSNSNSNGMAKACFKASSPSYAWYNMVFASAGSISGASVTWSTNSSICPAGWDMPSSTDFSTLITALNSDYSSFQPMATGLYDDRSFIASAYGVWWSSSYSGNNAKYYTLEYNSNTGTMSLSSRWRYDGISIRCVSYDTLAQTNSLQNAQFTTIPSPSRFIQIQNKDTQLVKPETKDMVKEDSIESESTETNSEETNFEFKDSDENSEEVTSNQKN